MRNIAAAAKLAPKNSEWGVIFAYPQSYDPTTQQAIALVTGKLIVQHQPRVLTLDYLRFAKEVMALTDTTAKELGKHMALRLGISENDRQNSTDEETAKRL